MPGWLGVSSAGVLADGEPGVAGVTAGKAEAGEDGGAAAGRASSGHPLRPCSTSVRGGRCQLCKPACRWPLVVCEDCRNCLHKWDTRMYACQCLQHTNLII